MADMFDQNKRREIMQAVKSKNSQAELIVYRYLNRSRIYYQKHYRKAPGSPDIALPRKKVAVFIDGDFWHGRSLEDLRKKKLADDYWIKKLEGNVMRDERQNILLNDAGWRILRVWESDIIRKKSREDVLLRIKDFLLNL